MINIDDFKPTKLTIYLNEALIYIYIYITMPTTFPWQQWLCKHATMFYVYCVSCWISPFLTTHTNYMGYMPHIFHLVDTFKVSQHKKLS